MGRAYQHEQRQQVRALLEAGRDEESIEKETGVSDRTIRRWKRELEATGRIGKPPESRTGRHRVLSPEIEAALFTYVKEHPDASVDDMLWWLYDTYKIVVGTRTIRRVFERKGTNFKSKARQSISGLGGVGGGDDDDDDIGVGVGVGEQHNDNEVGEDDSSLIQPDHYQSPYAPMAPMTTGQGAVAADHAEMQLAQALGQHTPQQQQPVAQSMALDEELPEDEETIQLQLQQIALQKREVELRLRMRRIKQGKPATPVGKEVQTTPSSLYKPGLDTGPSPPKRDSRSKKKQEESKRKTAERQERMLRELERRSRRREHLTAEWVQSKDIWPLRAQALLADLMHQHACYAFSQQHVEMFDRMYAELYRLVDLSKNDWTPHVHDEMLRERMKRKMAQLRTKMIKTGEIIPRNDGYGGFQKAEDYTGEQAGNTVGGDETEITADAFQAEPPPPLHQHDDTQLHHHHQDPQLQHHDPQLQHHDSGLQYDTVPDPNATPMQHHPNLPYGSMMHAHHHHHHHQTSPQYPLMPDQHHANMMPYGQLGGAQQGIGPENGMSVL